MAARGRLRAALLALCAAALLATLYWSRCADLATSGRAPGALFRPVSVVSSDGAGGARDAGGAGGAGSDIECSINGEYSVACRRDLGTDEVYVPFSFLHKYFEVYGKIAQVDGVDTFKWSHSYGKVYHPKRKYDPGGTFVTFENYNVEVRERVKCISGVHGVPVSTQWEPRGFYYPTQIAQFGLAHYSKNLTEPSPGRALLEDGAAVRARWQLSADARLRREAGVLAVDTAPRAASRALLPVAAPGLLLQLDARLLDNSSLTVALQHRDSRETFYLHYVPGDTLISAQDEHTWHGLGAAATWRRLTRDLLVDAQKGWALQDRPKRKFPRNKFKVSALWLSGSLSVDNVTLSTSAHWEQFLAAARWLVEQQTAAGAWPVPARRRGSAPVPDLPPGWQSAMAQGHGMSVLARAFLRTREPRYLRAARAARAPLAHVTARWMDRLVWYEEYPTKPPLFVLNGFMYTLLGLYDLVAAEAAAGDAGDGDGGVESRRMFAEGLSALHTLLPLFDAGSGSFYDLRHFTLGAAPNLARWDYHATHVNQLLVLADLAPPPAAAALRAAAARWEGYMRGRRAPHN